MNFATFLEKNSKEETKQHNNYLMSEPIPNRSKPRWKMLRAVCKQDFLRNASEDFLSLDPLGVGSDEMLVGRAGYLAGCLWLHQKIGCQVS